MRTAKYDTNTRLERLTLQLALSSIGVTGSRYDRVLALWMESLAAERGGDLLLALRIHRLVVNVAPEFYLVYIRAGRLSFKIGAYEQALAFYEKASDLSRDLAAGLQGAMMCYSALGNRSEAERISDRLNQVFLSKGGARSRTRSRGARKSREPVFADELRPRVSRKKRWKYTVPKSEPGQIMTNFS